jgi:HD superfamily phosphohydrolase
MRTIYHLHLSIVFWLAPFFITLSAHDPAQKEACESIIVDTLYGSFTITEPVLCELLSAPSVQRLKSINQYGIDAYVNNFPAYNRYQHSVGVMCILRRFGASLKEQIAALLHDVSHTVFSHVGDQIFEDQHKSFVEDTQSSYQDTIHAWFIKQTELASILASYGYAVEDIIHKNGTFRMLEQDLPDLCGDRIEYNLYGGYIENVLTLDDIRKILDALRYDDGRWYFVDLEAARRLAESSLFLTDSHFGSGWNGVLNKWAADMLRHALSSGLVTREEIHFSTDDRVWQQLEQSSDLCIQKSLHKLYHYNDHYHEVSPHEPYDYALFQKFRGVNPWVVIDGTYRRLYEWDQTIAQRAARIKKKLQDGLYIAFDDEV